MKKLFALFAILLFVGLFAAIGQSPVVNAGEITTTATTEEVTTTVTTTFGISVPSNILTDPLYQDIIQNETAQQIATLLGVSVGTLALILVGLFIAIKWLKKNYLNRSTNISVLNETLGAINTLSPRIDGATQLAALSSAEVEQLKPLLLTIGEGLFYVITTSTNSKLNGYAPEFQAKYAAAIAAFTQPISGIDKAVKLVSDEAMRLVRKPLPEIITDAKLILSKAEAVKSTFNL